MSLFGSGFLSHLPCQNTRTALSPCLVIYAVLRIAASLMSRHGPSMPHICQTLCHGRRELLDINFALPSALHYL